MDMHACIYRTFKFKGVEFSSGHHITMRHSVATNCIVLNIFR